MGKPLSIHACRFGSSSTVKQLPQWVRPHVKTFSKFGVVQRDLNLFFKNAEKEVN